VSGGGQDSGRLLTKDSLTKSVSSAYNSTQLLFNNNNLVYAYKPHETLFITYFDSYTVKISNEVQRISLCLNHNLFTDGVILKRDASSLILSSFSPAVSSSRLSGSIIPEGSSCTFILQNKIFTVYNMSLSSNIITINNTLSSIENRVTFNESISCYNNRIRRNNQYTKILNTCVRVYEIFEQLQSLTNTVAPSSVNVGMWLRTVNCLKGKLPYNLKRIRSLIPTASKRRLTGPCDLKEPLSNFVALTTLVEELIVAVNLYTSKSYNCIPNPLISFFNSKQASITIPPNIKPLLQLCKNELKFEIDSMRAATVSCRCN
jgi:hypothetical protein